MKKPAIYSSSVGALARAAALMLCVTVTGAMGQSVAPVNATINTQASTVRITGAQVSHETLAAVLPGEHVRVEKFAVPGAQVDLELDRVEVLTENARLELGTSDGIVDLERPDVVILTGIVAGKPDSQAYIAVSPYGTNGFISLDGDLISISTGPYAQDKNLNTALRSAYMNDLIDPDAGAAQFCGYENGDARYEPNGGAIEYPHTDGRGSTCRIASVAIETDWEYNSRLFGGNSNAAAAYVVSLMGAISEIYERDFNVRLAVPFLRIWDDDSDPYSPAQGDPLDQVRDYWNANMGGVDRTITHFFTGRQDTSYGGVAYLSVLCNGSYGYGVSAHLSGSFPYPLVDYNHGNWDVIVAAHEMGHNFGSPHTHDFNPQIDGCGTGDCSHAFGGTIMSYCHTCAGGLSNIQLSFHPRVIDTVIGYMGTVSCDLVSTGVTAAADSVSTLEDTAIDIDAMSNDASLSCDAFVFDSVDSASIQGGTIERLAGQGPAGRDLFRYTPPLGFTGLDGFTYRILSDHGVSEGQVTIDVRALRDADNRINPIAGLKLSYYQLNSPQVLPDFTALTPIGVEVSESVNYPSTTGEFINSGLSDNVGAVFEGYVWAMLDGEYIFSTDSDDGSRLLIGDEVVVNNDGLHGMVKRTGSIPLHAGWHRIRIEFFEAGGGAGIISTMSGPGMTEQVLLGLFLSHESGDPCSPADLNGDGTLDFFDVSGFLTAFGDHDPIADFNGDGVYNFFDISAFLIAFNAGCP